MSTSDPIVCTVFRDKLIRGWEGREDQIEDVEYGVSLPFEKALRSEYKSDAHATQYVVPGEQATPRLNKAALGYFEREVEQVWWPELRSVFVDIDFPDHGNPNRQYGWGNKDQWPDTYKEWEQKISRAFDQSPELQVATVYQTRGGMRFCWELDPDRWAPLPYADHFLALFYDYLIDDLGLPADRLDKWTRMFRLPCVVRDGQKTEHRLNLSRAELLDWNPPEPLQRKPPPGVADIDFSGAEMPNPDDAKTPTKRELKPLRQADKWYYPNLRDGEAISHPEKHSRHNSYVSAVCSAVSALDIESPREIFRFFVEPARSTIKAQDSTQREFDWRELWGVCKWAVRRHIGEKKQQSRIQKSFLEKQAEAMGCEPREVRSRLILYTTQGSTFYIWHERRKRYAVQCSQASQLYPLLAEHCPRASRILEDQVRQSQDILDQFGLSVDRVVYSYIANRVELDEQTRVLTVPVLNRDPRIEPEYHDEIHTWLEFMGGGRREELLDWIATARRYDRQTCALYIHGPPGIGKDLLASGLARLYQTSPTTYSELSDNFHSAFLDCPLIYASEQIPDNPMGESGSAVFRRAVGQSSRKLSIKYESKADLEGAPRILIGANNDRAIQTGEHLQSADIEALRQRIGYIETDEKPREYLKDLAEKKDCAVQDFTQEWVDGGKIAEHWLWLENNRDVQIGDRFLVEGWQSKLTRTLVFRFGEASSVMRFILASLRDGKQTSAIRVDEEGVWVNIGRLQADFQRIVSGDLSSPGHQETLAVLETLSEDQTRSMDLEESRGMQARQFWCIEPDALVEAADYYSVAIGSEIEKAIEQRLEQDQASPSENVHAMDSLQSIENTGE